MLCPQRSTRKKKKNSTSTNLSQLLLYILQINYFAIDKKAKFNNVNTRSMWFGHCKDCGIKFNFKDSSLYHPLNSFFFSKITIWCNIKWIYSQMFAICFPIRTSKQKIPQFRNCRFPKGCHPLMIACTLCHNSQRRSCIDMIKYATSKETNRNKKGVKWNKKRKCTIYSYQTLVTKFILGGSNGYPSGKEKKKKKKNKKSKTNIWQSIGVFRTFIPTKANQHDKRYTLE